jgi:hypothetical protein
MGRLESAREEARDNVSAQYAAGELSARELELVLERIERADSLTTLRSIVRAEDRRDPDEGRTVTAILGERRMTGDWLRHRHVTAIAAMGSLSIDLTDCVLESNIAIHLVAVMGEIEILVPVDVRVRDDVGAVLAEYSDRAGAPGGDGGAELRLTGVALLAEIRIRRAGL